MDGETSIIIVYKGIQYLFLDFVSQKVRRSYLILFNFLNLYTEVLVMDSEFIRITKTGKIMSIM